MDAILDEVVLTCLEDEVEESLDNLTNPEYSEPLEEDAELEFEQETRYTILLD
jgi:hypothetical protein